MAWCPHCGEAIMLHAPNGQGPCPHPRRPRQVQFDQKGEVTAEPLLDGDSGVQGSLLGSPASTGESLALDDLPMFKEES